MVNVAKKEEESDSDSEEEKHHKVNSNREEEETDTDGSQSNYESIEEKLRDIKYKDDEGVEERERDENTEVEVEKEKEDEDPDVIVPTEEIIPQFRDPPIYKETKRGDSIEYYEKETDLWKEAMIVPVLKRWKEWYNIKHIDGSQCSVNLGKETMEI